MLNSIEQIRNLNRDTGGHWFDDNTMEFFDSIVYSRVYPVSDGAYFVSSEKFDNKSPRFFSVRRAYDDGRIDTKGEFQGYATLRQARDAAALLQAGQRMLATALLQAGQRMLAAAEAEAEDV